MKSIHWNWISSYPQYHHSPINWIFEYCHDILGAFSCRNVMNN